MLDHSCQVQRHSKANSGMAFGWFVWIRGYNDGPTILDRISWER